MAEYIDRKKAIDACFDGWNNNAHDCAENIRSIPAADVRPVVRGKWIKEFNSKVHYNQYKCSVCDKFSGHDSQGWIWAPNYCPNCGAMMEES